MVKLAEQACFGTIVSRFAEWALPMNLGTSPQSSVNSLGHAVAASSVSI
ncbi:hypothetical protein [Burkholderia sp. AU45388]|nr:hypothetical protein [Burkholderia sp. AU45388]MDN7430404.1 hypothetical protein [Burkholderia sp. AU45388]